MDSMTSTRRWAVLGLLPLLLVAGASTGLAKRSAPPPRTLVATRAAI
jgi:hypothetical protein